MGPFPGWVLTRALPPHVLHGVASGAYQVCGGVVRGNGGRIVAHLVETFNPLSAVTSAVPVIGPLVSGLNTVQLYRLGKDMATVKEGVNALQAATANLALLARGTMALSGLTLAVSAAGFVFLNTKLNKLDSKLNELAKDVRAIKRFLEIGERSRLLNALKTLDHLTDSVPAATRTPMLVQAKTTIGEVYERYNEVYRSAATLQDAEIAEQYFAIAAISNAICMAELDLLPQARDFMSEAFTAWSIPTSNIARQVIAKSQATWFFSPGFVEYAPIGDIAEWQQLIENDPMAVADLVEKMRSVPTRDRKSRYIDKPVTEEMVEIAFLRRTAARVRVLRGYYSQLCLCADHGIRPSALGVKIQEIARASADSKTEDCLVFVPETEMA